jgi:predicted RND superfamily exporter protein
MTGGREFPVRVPSGLVQLWSRRGMAGIAFLLAVLSSLAVGRWVDLVPRVEGEFFFADDDPQLAASREIRSRFRLGEQVILRVRDPGATAADPLVERDATVQQLESIADALTAIEGVEAAYSAASHDADDPLYGRILATPDPAVTNIVLQVDATDPRILVPRLEAVVEALGGDLDIVLSGPPVIVEWIRRNLLRDLIVFTAAAVLVFALLVGVIYRDPAILVGTLVTSALAVNVTLLILHALGVAIGLLTANLATIVFVLTLSHMVFITANARRAASEGAPGAVGRGVAQTLEGSFWGMATTLLGFLSLLVATARPLRELGIAGAVGAVVALVAAYLVYPAFLAGWARLGQVAPAPDPPGPDPQAPDPEVPAAEASAPIGPVPAPALGRLPGVAVGGIAMAGLVLAFGVSRLDTDPNLLTYFAPGSDLRDGLERIDSDGGSSPLYVTVRDAAGADLDSDLAYEKLAALQTALEADERVGVVLGPSVLIDQARTMPLARFLPISVLLDIASSPRLDEVALGFVTAERDEGLFSLRMRESVEVPSRDGVMTEVDEMVRAVGLETVLVAGLYDLQARLGHLIRESLAVGIGGLLLLFLGVAAVVSRRLGTTVRMWVCLAGIPLVVLGTFGWLGIAVDIITSPAANVALAVGVDSMIHLVVRARRFQAAGWVAPWSEALDRVRGPVLAATGILGAGFGIFVLSSFPPTRRFGLVVILGTATAAALALVVLPRWAGRASAAPVSPLGSSASTS